MKYLVILIGLLGLIGCITNYNYSGMGSKNDKVALGKADVAKEDNELHSRMDADISAIKKGDTVKVINDATSYKKTK